MKLEFKAGPFTLSTWTDGHPHWMELKHNDDILGRFHHSELADLEHIVKRMRAQGRAHMPDNYKHEYD
jgi:hypothetical protein